MASGISKRKFITDTIFKDDSLSEIPLIKVTVIPKTVETQTSRVFNKRRQIVKRVQSTISNQESSLRSKNIYLVVTGRKADKIYEIKTTGSEKLSSSQTSSRVKYEDISLNKLSNYKKVIESLNMDKKKKRDKKKKTGSPQRNDSRSSLINEIFGGAGITLQECICSNTKRKDTLNKPTKRRSRVRITGQLGVSNDDKYVINYAATIDDEPVIPNYIKMDQKVSADEMADSSSRLPESTKSTSCFSTSNDMYNNKKYFRNQRDCNIQANLLESSVYRPFSKNRSTRLESQAIQVDLDKYLPLDKIRKNSSKDQTMQCYCNCTNVTDELSTTTEAVTRSSTIKEIKSPLVIISVYPKRESVENVKSSHTLINKRQISPNRNTRPISPQANKNKTKPNIQRSRSPSPATRIYTKDNNLNQVVDTRFLSTKKKIFNYRSTSPTNHKKDSSRTELSNNTKKSKTRAEFFRKFPVSFGSRASKDININSVKKKNFVNNAKTSTVSKKDAGNGSSLSKNSSVVKRNDDENERYVMWDQRNLHRNLGQRKMFKKQESRKSSDDDYGSMENFLMLSEKKGELNKGSNNDARCMKFTQTSRSYDRLYDSQSNSNFFEFTAPIKHYHGDSCKVIDPFERDKEIRKLLGLQCRHTVPEPVKQDCYSGMFSRDTPQRSKRSEVKLSKKSLAACMSRTLECKCCNSERKPPPRNRQCKIVKTKTTTTQYDLKSLSPPSSSSPLSPRQPEISDKQQLILNRNIQVYLQIEQFTKQKPIMLTRKQYDKLKKTIQSTVKLKPPKQDKSIKNIFKTYSIVSEGKVKKAPKNKNSVIRNKGMQTHKGGKKSRKQQMSAKSSNINTSKKSSCVCVEVQTICSQLDKKPLLNYMLFDKQGGLEPANTSKEDIPRQTMSSLEIRCANVAYRRVTFSSTGQIATESLYSDQIENNSLHSFFKRQNRPHSPNIGISAYSVYSEATGSRQSLKHLLSSRDSKQKRPFLRRLMSCLVMHSARASNVKIPCGLTGKISGVNSSIDSYYISTSLGAIELSSSMYDTSASFYSNHTIFPINKIKRGFLSSVRGFLANRRS
ncbi:uncharacterized protein [Battus philenor]|uniref:uncharacterized protein n=1 Tax=Battus philenor TaxID=42288 RepID=UPI0035D0D940